MEQSIKKDIKQHIYENKVDPPFLLEKLLEILESIEMKYENKIAIETREKDGKLKVGKSGHYFIVRESNGKKTKAIFAGNLGETKFSKRNPAVRVRDSNVYLTQVNDFFKGTYDDRTEPWTYVAISIKTIDTFEEMLNYEVENFFQNVKKGNG
jgi:hypothetical protein